MIDFNKQFGLKTARPLWTYGSILFIIREQEHSQKMAELEVNVQQRNDREAELLRDYEAKIDEL